MRPVTDPNSEDDGVIFRNVPQANVRLMNSEIKNVKILARILRT